MQGREVKYLPDDILQVLFLFDENHSIMDHFTGDLADDMDSNNLQSIAYKDQFKESRFGSEDFSSSHICIARFSHAIVEFAGNGFFFRYAYHRNFRNSIDAIGEMGRKMF